MTTMTAAQIRAQTAPMDQVPDPQVPERPRPPRQYPAAYKLRILSEYEQLDKADKVRCSGVRRWAKPSGVASRRSNRLSVAWGIVRR